MAYTHIYAPISKIKIVQQKIKYSGSKETKNYIYQMRTKLTKAQTGKQW